MSAQARTERRVHVDWGWGAIGIRAVLGYPICPPVQWVRRYLNRPTSYLTGGEALVCVGCSPKGGGGGWVRTTDNTIMSRVLYH